MINEILQNARMYAETYHHPYVGPVHILFSAADKLGIELPGGMIKSGDSPQVLGQTQTIYHLLAALSEEPTVDEIMEKLYKKHPFTRKVYTEIKKRENILA